MSHSVAGVFVALLAFRLLLPPRAAGQDQKPNPVVDGILSSFDLPLGDLLKNDPGKNRLLQGLSVNAGFSLPLIGGKPAANAGSGTQGPQTSTSPFGTLSIKYSPLTYWFFQTTLYKYTSPELQAPWNPDFTYSFGYDDYHPYTFSLVYSNYGGNRLFPDASKGQIHTAFAQGSWALGWKFQFPKRVEDQLKLFTSSAISGSTHYTVTPTYLNSKTSTIEHAKQNLSLSVQYNVYKFWYWNITAFYYPIPAQQQPWDPDYTYGFGYFDYRPGKISVEYNNYSGNRYPWRKSTDSNGTFRKGGISISYGWAW